jgi:peptide/nickel transport system substrate-binding protein
LLIALKQTLRKIANYFPERKRVLYLPRLFSRQEKIIFLALLCIAVVSGTFSLARFIARNTERVPAFGGIYREGLLKQPRLINPLFLTSNDTDRDIAKLVYASLISFDAEGSPVPDLAESYEITDENKTYTFVLRENARWHDGKPVTADDVVFTVKTAQNPAYASPERPNWQGVIVEKLDDKTLRMTLRQPYASFINNLTLGILPKHLWENIDPISAQLNELNLRPIGSGPYMFSGIEKTKELVSHIVLEANPRYHRAGPHLKRIEFFFFTSEDELTRALKINAIDGIGGVSSEQFEHPPINVAQHIFATPSVFGVFLNANKLELLADKDIRMALLLALDRERIRKEAAGETTTAAHTPIPAGVFELAPDTYSPLPYDPEKAKEILDKRGFREDEQEGIRIKKEQKAKKEIITPLRITLATSNAPQLARAAELIKTMWGEIGVAVELNVLPIIELESSVIRPRTYETLLFGEVYSHDPDPFSFWHSSQIKDPGLNIAMYSNQKTDELLADARKTADREARQKKYEEFQKIIANDIGAIFLYSPSYPYLINKKVNGIREGTIVLPADRFNEVTQWFIDTKRIWKK